MASDSTILKPNIVETKLRTYQLEAVGFLNDYISRYDNAETEESALIGMPTGSGKTAIIGSVACCLPREGIVLVVSPRKAVVNQLYTELSGNLFSTKFELGGDLLPTKEVLNDLADPEEVTGDKVLCWTIQKLHMLKSLNKTLFDDLLSKVSLILFDEGHYEPAEKWSNTIRKFKVPRVIFTATPFRNDFKTFDIDWDTNVYQISYDKLAEEKFLRKVSIEDLGVKANIADALGDALSRFDNLKREHNDARMIVKCDNFASIVEIAQELKRNNRSFFAIHERFDSTFKNSNPNLASNLQKSVPADQHLRTEEIWVHQYKLVEGIDSPHFRCLAIIDPLTNTRALVQQIGRIIRNPDRTDNLGYVYNYTRDNYEAEWDAFRSMDSKKLLTKTLEQQVFEELSNNLSSEQYVDKKVRIKLTEEQFEEWSEEDLMTNLQLPLKVNLLQVLDSWDSQVFNERYLEFELRNKHHVFFKNIYGDESGLYLYFSVGNSPYLTKTYFPEVQHHICFYKRFDNFLAFFDSGRMLPIGRDDVGIGFGVSTNSLRSVFKNGTDSVVNQVSLKNSNIGSLEAYSHSYIASSVEGTTPNLNDFSHFLSSARGYYRDKKEYREYKNKELSTKEFLIPTYVGFGRGRVSQSEGKNVSFKEYLDWIEYLKKSIEQRSNYVTVFNRYATEISEGVSGEAQSILLDLFEFETQNRDQEEEEIATESETRLVDRIQERFYELNKDEGSGGISFNLKVENREYLIKINFDTVRKKFKLISPELEVQTEESQTEPQQVFSLIKEINKRQRFRILTENNLSYSGGRFYKPHFKFGNDFDEELSPLPDVLISIDALDTTFSEKGSTSVPGNTGWQANSIFQLIANMGAHTELASFFTDYGNETSEFLICTDLGTEPADFIYVSNKRIAFIHVKGKGNIDGTEGSKVAASPISEVLSQSVKNAHYLSVFDNTIPKNINRWVNPWKIESYIVNNRICLNNLPNDRLDPTDKHSIWSYIQKKKMKSSINKEIWVVTGGCLSKKKFLEEIASASPKAEAKQAAMLIESTLASVQSLGIKLKLFCSNYD